MKISFEKTKEIVSKIDGWLSNKQIRFLYETAKNCKGKGVIVEIGSWKGKSTVCLARGSKMGSNTKIYAIDPHISEKEHKIFYGNKSTIEEFKRNIKMAKVDDIVEPIVKTSEGAARNWNKPIEFLWVDGDHSYEMAKLDFDLWSPYLIEGGIIAFHDSGEAGVKRVICDLVSESNNFKNSGLVNSIFYAQKIITNSLSTKDKIRNKYILFLLNLNKVFNKMPIPKFLKRFIKSIAKKLLKV